MATPSTTLLTGRDREVLEALDRCPLTVRQLLRLSEAFAAPFTTERRVQERMARLRGAGRVRRWPYATAGRGALSYFTLSPEGYRILHGHEVTLPRSNHFSPVGVARQAHTRSLADFLVHLLVAAHRAGVDVADFARENALRLEADGEALYPDGAFTLVRQDGARFRYFVELDTGSERLHSQASLDSVERKVRFYDAYQDSLRPERFHVLVVTTGSAERLGNLLACASRVVKNRQRSLVYGVTLADFLLQGEALTAPCFRDNAGHNVVLVLPPRQERPHPLAAPLHLAPLAAV